MNKDMQIKDTPSFKQLFLIFLKLGCTSFGGPVAHIGFFNQEFVIKRKWYSEDEYLQLVALSQMLPGPASSQVGMAIGYKAKSYLGSLVSFIGFTLPSAILMACFALLIMSSEAFNDSSVLYILKIVAVAVVAQAIWTMSKAQCSDSIRASIAILSACIALYAESAYIQLIIIIFGGIAGKAFCSMNEPQALSSSITRLKSHKNSHHLFLIAAFFLILLLSPLLNMTNTSEFFSIFDSFYRSGALVFGGGHVVLPLLESELVSTALISQNQFLYGYGLAQAIPGPLFTFASYLGVLLPISGSPLLGGIVASIAIFLPGYLLIIGILPFWHKVANNPSLSSTIKGVNSAVIGLLIASFFDPIWLGTIHSNIDIILTILIFSALMIWKFSPLKTVLTCAFLALLFDFF